MRILVADDHELVRDTISAYLEREPDIEARAASSMEEAGRVIEEEGPFDLVLLDYAMPGVSGLEGLHLAMRLNGGKPVALISGAAGQDVAKAALAAGAAGFLPKTMAARSLVHAIRFMVSGEQYAPIQFLQAAEEEAPDPFEARLTPREKQVLGGLCRGLANKEIARELELQEVTVKLHVKTICRKLDARNRTHAAMIAKEAGFS
ncbi:MAG: response regulator transcription factor [Pikeienuella sp.]|uniref:response regulator transcription factor n=1 Tax=Pikeienuella sp. TaxID=2831957 RepID=UPI00391A1942